MHRLKILLVPCRRIVVCAHSGRGHCVMFFRNTYYSCGRSLHPGVQMDIDEFNAGATLASHPGGWGGGSGGVEKFLVASCH